MHLRTSIFVVGAVLAIVAPAATAQIAPDPQNEQSQPISNVAHDYAGLQRVSGLSWTGPLTENSFGSSLPQTRPTTGTIRSNTKDARTKAATNKALGYPDQNCFYAFAAPSCH
jgi:hypothetical protein